MSVHSSRFPALKSFAVHQLGVHRVPITFLRRCFETVASDWDGVIWSKIQLKELLFNPLVCLRLIFVQCPRRDSLRDYATQEEFHGKQIVSLFSLILFKRFATLVTICHRLHYHTYLLNGVIFYITE